MSTVISVEHLSKTYRLGQIGTGTFPRGPGSLAGQRGSHFATNCTNWAKVIQKIRVIRGKRNLSLEFENA
jgi:hypothetical protein